MHFRFGASRASHTSLAPPGSGCSAGGRGLDSGAVLSRDGRTSGHQETRPCSQTTTTQRSGKPRPSGRGSQDRRWRSAHPHLSSPVTVPLTVTFVGTKHTCQRGHAETPGGMARGNLPTGFYPQTKCGGRKMRRKNLGERENVSSKKCQKLSFQSGSDEGTEAQS